MISVFVQFSLLKKKRPWTRSTTGGPWTPGPCFVLTPTGNPSGLEFRNEKGVKRHHLTYEETDQQKSVKNTGRIFINDAEMSKRDRSIRIQ